MFKCERCGNSDERFVGYLNGKPYCRRCISFSGEKVEDIKKDQNDIKLQLSYHLSKDQDLISKRVLESINKGKNVLIHAITGSGKTELVYRSIESTLSKGGNVGFAIPRRDVVIDLAPRISSAFPAAEVVSIYKDHAEKLNGDIIILTTHQLYRYEKFFDLLIVDEIDAFPYKDNEVLESFLKKSIRGNYIFLSATPSQDDILKVKKDNGVIFELFERYHHNPLPLPSYCKPELNSYLTCKSELTRLLSLKKQVFVFVPTIKIGKTLFKFLNYFIKGGEFVNSLEEQRGNYIKQFKQKNFRYLVTTAILERGVTVKDLQVIVFRAEHKLYTKEALIQIAGRVGRKFDAPKGEVILIGEYKSETIRKCIEEISNINKKAGL